MELAVNGFETKAAKNQEINKKQVQKRAKNKTKQKDGRQLEPIQLRLG